MKKSISRYMLVEIIAASLLVLLWTLSAGEKLADLSSFRLELSKQVFNEGFNLVLFYAVPALELAAALLLLTHRTRLVGFMLSAVLMGAFSIYIALVIAGYFNKVPCACISIIDGMNFELHLVFNLFFTAVAVTGTIYTIKERRTKGMDSILSHAPLPGRH